MSLGGEVKLAGSQQALNTTFYNKTIDQSLRFNDDDSAYLSRTPGSAGNRKTFTYSTWVKRGKISADNPHWGISAGTLNNSSNPRTEMLFSPSDNIVIGFNTGSWFESTTNAKFRDTSAWYHFVVSVDMTQSTASDRMKFYVNGVLQTFSTYSVPAQNTDLPINNTLLHGIGEYIAGESSASYQFDGYLAEIHLIDGTALGPEYFGENKNGVWIPKRVTGVTYGTNGFHLDFANSGDIGNDISGNGNDYTPNNLAATDVVQDSPTNNYPTFNPLDKSTTVTLSEGNLKYTYNSRPNSRTIRATQSLPSFGKYYWEMKNEQANTTPGRISGGIVNQPSQGGVWDVAAYSDADHIDYSYGGGLYSNGVSLGTSLTWYNNERAAVAVDCDNGKFWFGKVFQNGSTTWFDSSAGETGNPVTGVNPTVNDLVFITNYVPYMGWHEGGSGSEVFSGSINFGQETFLGTIPSGYKTLSNFNLPEPVAVNPRNDSIENSFFYTTLYEGNGGGQRVGQFLPLNEVKTVNNAIRFEDGDSAYLNRTPGSAGNRKTWTWSGWVKRGNLGTLQGLFHCFDGVASRRSSIVFNTDNTIGVDQGGSGTSGLVDTVAVFGDTSAWYHIVVRADYSNGTASDRVKIYVNGVLQSVSTPDDFDNADGLINSTNTHELGSFDGSGQFLDGYMADVHFVDGQALDPTSFGQTDPSTEQWIPKTFTGNHGQNGFHLEFLNNTVGADSANTNSFTPVNLGTANTVIDTPTKNFSTLELMMGPAASGAVFNQGNLRFTTGTTGSARNQNRQAISTIQVEYGKWYAEFRVEDNNGFIGVGPRENVGATSNNVRYIYYYGADGNVYQRTTSASETNAAHGSGLSAGDIVGILLDMDNRRVAFSKNGQWADGSGNTDQASPTSYITFGEAFFDSAADDVHKVGFLISSAAGATSHESTANFGQESSFAGNIAASANTDGLGAEFKYTPPTGAKALNVDNLPFKNTRGIARRKQPALTWIKNRDDTDSHVLVDQVRGLSNGTVLFSNLDHQANTNVNSVQKLLPGGFQIGNDVKVNTAGESYVAWNWAMHDDVINAGLVYNTDGDIPSYVMADKRLGFSILKYTHDGTNASTVGHGLSQTPEWIINKQISHSASNWRCYHTSLTSGYNIQLNLTTAQGTAADIYPSAPSASVFTPGNGDSASGRDFISYCWHSVPGFSAFGSYTGNGSTDGIYVHLGFKPAWFMIKRSDNSSHWALIDSARSPYNVSNAWLAANLTNSESSLSNNPYDLLSNGFKARDTLYNVSGGTYIYLAFAESPFKYPNAR